MDTMKVKARPGGKVPFEDKPREYITDEKAVDVPATSYYRRLVSEGSLVLDKGETKTRPSASSKGGEA